MDHTYAALLLDAAGTAVTEERLRRVLDGAGAEPVPARVTTIDELTDERSVRELAAEEGDSEPLDDPSIYAALLLNEAGKPITEGSVSGVLAAAEAGVAGSRIRALVDALEDVSIEDAIAGAAGEDGDSTTRIFDSGDGAGSDNDPAAEGDTKVFADGTERGSPPPADAGEADPPSFCPDCGREL